MKKSIRTLELEGDVFRGVVVHLDELVVTVDPDRLQLMDELNEDWVSAWRKEVKKVGQKKRDKKA
jgi:hypothetical protein